MENKQNLSRKTNKVDCTQDSMQQAAWVPNATGNTATPTVASWPYPGGSGFHTAIIATLPPGTTRNGKETGNMGRRGKHVARTKPSKTKTKIRTKLTNGKHTGWGSSGGSIAVVPPGGDATDNMKQTNWTNK